MPKLNFDQSEYDFLTLNDTRQAAGMRLRSITMYGNPAAPSYAGVWVVRPNEPEQSLLVNVPVADAPEIVHGYRRLNYNVRMIGATGTSEEDAICCLLFDKVSADDGTFLFDTDNAGLKSILFQQADPYDGILWPDTRLRWAASYGRASNDSGAGIRHLCVFTPEPAAGRNGWNVTVNWKADFLTMAKSVFKQGWVRAALIVPASGGGFLPDQYLCIWEDTMIKQYSKLEMPADVFAAALEFAADHGYWPSRVMALSDPGYRSTRFSAIFTKLPHDKPYPRKMFPVMPTLHTTGGAFPGFVNEPSGYQAFDNYVTKLMQFYNVRAAQLAMTYKGRLVFAHAYTYAEEGYPITKNTTRFRVGSISKSICATATMMYLDDRAFGTGLADLELPVESFLGNSLTPFVQPDKYDGPKEPRFADIKLWHCISHAAGFNAEFSDDSAGIRKTMRKWNTLLFPWPGTGWPAVYPVSKPECMAYASDQDKPLDFDPGTNTKYNGFGFFVAGCVIQKMKGPGWDYAVAIGTDLFVHKLHLDRPRLTESIFDGLTGEEARYHAPDPQIAPTAENESGAWVPGTYAIVPVNTATDGSWSMAAVDLARFVAAFDIDNGLPDQNPLMSDAAQAVLWHPLPPPPVQAPGGATYPSDSLLGWFSYDWNEFSGFAPKGQKPPSVSRHAVYMGGATAGSCALAMRRDDGWSFALVMNKDFPKGPDMHGKYILQGEACLRPELHGKELSQIATTFTLTQPWPSYDLFTEFNIPSFYHPWKLPPL